MSLIPISSDPETVIFTSRTFGVKENKIVGYISGKEAMQQAIFFMLSTERYKHVIHSWDYGHEINNLMGKDKEYVKTQLPRLITECLTQDDRISDVNNFIFTDTEEGLLVKFTAITNEGNIESEVVV